MARRLGALALAALLPTLSAPAAADDRPRAGGSAGAPAEAELPPDPSYDPAAHGGLPYTAYLRMTRGTARRSTGMMVAGIVITSLGAITQAASAPLYAAPRCITVFDPFTGVDSERCAFDPARRTTALALLVAGTIGVALGVPLWVVGQSQVPWMEAASVGQQAPPAWARLVPIVTPEARGAGLLWRF